jgi:hypothetical protein
MAFFSNLVFVTYAIFFVVWSGASPTPRDPDAACRAMPGDPDWPNAEEWKKLNSTVGGRLIATVPLATPCHDPHYDGPICAFLKEQWDLAEVQ